jgi:hypothetical protein
VLAARQPRSTAPRDRGTRAGTASPPASPGSRPRPSNPLHRPASPPRARSGPNRRDARTAAPRHRGRQRPCVRVNRGTGHQEIRPATSARSAIIHRSFVHQGLSDGSRDHTQRAPSSTSGRMGQLQSGRRWPRGVDTGIVRVWSAKPSRCPRRRLRFHEPSLT